MKTLVCAGCGKLMTTEARRKAACGRCGTINAVPRDEVETKPGPGTGTAGNGDWGIGNRERRTANGGRPTADG